MFGSRLGCVGGNSWILVYLYYAAAQFPGQLYSFSEIKDNHPCPQPSYIPCEPVLVGNSPSSFFHSASCPPHHSETNFWCFKQPFCNFYSFFSPSYEFPTIKGLFWRAGAKHWCRRTGFRAKKQDLAGVSYLLNFHAAEEVNCSWAVNAWLGKTVTTKIEKNTFSLCFWG